jgi:hypothetical protein
MAYHVLSNVDRDMSPAIVYRDGVTDHLREDGARATPGSNYFLVPTLIHVLHPFEQLRLYEGTFL